MAIATGTVTTATGKSQGTSTWSHTTASVGNRMLLVFCGLRGNTSINSVKYGTAALTKKNSASSSSNKLEAWYLVNPPAGTHDIVVTYSNSTVYVLANAGISLSGVDQDAPIGPDGTSNTSFSKSITTTVSNSMLYGAAEAYYTNGAFSPGTGVTEEFDFNGINGTVYLGIGGGYRECTSTGSYTWEVTRTGSPLYKLCSVVEIKPAATGGGPVGARTRHLWRGFSGIQRI